nr:copia protein [Tanacetum cinerariifolium]
MVTRSRVETTRPNPRYTGHVFTISPLPRYYKEAFNDPNWRNAMFDEYNALIKNKTWTSVPRPEGANIVHCMWLFYHKFLADSTLSRYKARLVANGSTQLDVKNAFLHGNLAETVYMHQPLSFRDPEHPNYVCLLQRSLYGLKQAPRAWFQRFAAYITTVGFTPSRCDSSLFIYKQGDDTTFLLLYVDDIVLTASTDRLLQQIIASLHREFSMTDLGALNNFLGISVTRDTSGTFLSHRKYAMEILERAHIVGCNPSRTHVDTESNLGDGRTPVVDRTLYRSLAGSLQYLTFTRPDITYAVQQVCLYMHDPREPYFSALKRILRYVQGNLDYGLQLFSYTTDSLIAYSDGDWAGCPTTRRSTSGAEAEYRGVANVVAETCWIRNLLRELHTPLSSATIVYCDNAAKVGISSLSDAKALEPALVLDDSCAHEPDLALSLVGKLKDVNSWFSMIQQASNSFSVDERVVWIDVEGVPLCAWSYNTFTRIASIWGTLLYDDDENLPHFHRKCLCIKTSFQDIILASQKIIVKGKVFLIRVKELTGWAPSFNDDSNSDDESVDSQEASILKDEFSDKNSDMEEISETVFDKSEHVRNISPAYNEVRMESRVEEKSEDPFNIYDMLNKKKPIKSVEHSDSVKASFQEDVNVSGFSGHFQSVKDPKSGGSILYIIEDFIKVGQTMGYKMEGCIKDFEEIETKMEKVDLFNIKACWGNINFDYVVSSSVGNSGGILCVWDPNLFYKENFTVSDYFIAIMRNWLPNNKKWNGEVLLMGDFNEVRLEEESGLVEVPSGGFSFTWSHSSATKMSRLDRFLVSKNLQRSCPNLSSLTLDHGFDSFISDTWCNINIIEPNAMFKMAKKLKILKGHIRVWVKDKRASASNLKKDLKNKLSNIDSLIDKGKGDPLSPFLFILVMEILHLSFQNVVNAGLFKGVVLNNSLQLSHLFYADDAIFIGQWCTSNITAIIRVLECFFYASGLRVNLQKSKLMGVAVENSLVTSAANNIGCMTLSLTFPYLGVNVGGHMSQIASWDLVINKVLSRLSKWKMKVLSVGGRLTLLKSIKMMLVKWNNVLASKEMGGLGVSSFYALNRTLIFKWVWRFLTQGNSIWTKVIKALHGEEDGCGQFQEMESFLSLRLENILMIKFWERLALKPNGVSLSRLRGLKLQAILCPSCNLAVESTDHLFFSCSMMKDLYASIAKWWDVNMPEFSSFEEW